MFKAKPGVVGEDKKKGKWEPEQAVFYRYGIPVQDMRGKIWGRGRDRKCQPEKIVSPIHEIPVVKMELWIGETPYT